MPERTSRRPWSGPDGHITESADSLTLHTTPGSGVSARELAAADETQPRLISPVPESLADTPLPSEVAVRLDAVGGAGAQLSYTLRKTRTVLGRGA